jgi:hypothetical protein
MKCIVPVCFQSHLTLIPFKVFCLFFANVLMMGFGLGKAKHVRELASKLLHKRPGMLQQIFRISSIIHAFYSLFYKAIKDISFDQTQSKKHKK